jgi:hypothetical protein
VLQFRPFCALLYNEPGSTLDDGVLDISPVLAAGVSSEFHPQRLVNNPALVTDWLTSGHLTRFVDPSFYIVRAGWRDSAGIPVQISGVFGLAGADAELQGVELNGVELEGVELQGVESADAQGPGDATEVLVEPTNLVLPGDDLDLLLQPSGLPIITATVAGAHYRVWPLTQAGIVRTLAELVNPHLRTQIESGPDALGHRAAHRALDRSPYPRLVLASNSELSVPPGLVLWTPPQ